MIISLMSVITVNLLLSAFLICTLPLLNRESCLKSLSGRLLAGCCIAVMVRALIPVEFPFARTILVSKVLPTITRFLRAPFTVSGFPAKVFHLLLLIWILVALFLILKKGLLYFRLQKTVRHLPACTDKAVADAMEALSKKYPAAAQIKVVKTSLPVSPLATGVRKKMIVLPSCPFSAEEYRLILEHELLHCIRMDILIKFAADILCMAYWWNPLFYVLRRKIFELIELDNDRRMTASFSTEERVAYMRCLVDTAGKIHGRPIPFTLSFGEQEETELHRRIRLIGEFKAASRKRETFLFVMVLFLLLALTSLDLEPYDMPEGDSYFLLTPENSYFIQKGDSYDLYYEREFFFTIDSTEYFDSDIPIYQEEGDD